MSSDVAWVLPEALRSTFSMRYGPVLSGPEAIDRVRSLGVFASCGDMVTRQAIDLGRVPLVGIVDYKTRRSEPIDPAAFQPLADRRLVRVRNPAGMLTQGLRTAVHETIAAGGGLVVVDGEEDMGALALVEEMPAGATVIYGIPGAGVSFVTVDGTTKQRVRELIGRLERRSVDLGA